MKKWQKRFHRTIAIEKKKSRIFWIFSKKWGKQRTKKYKIGFWSYFDQVRAWEKGVYVWKLLKKTAMRAMYFWKKKVEHFRILSILKTKVTRAACQFWNVTKNAKKGPWEKAFFPKKWKINYLCHICIVFI